MRPDGRKGRLSTPYLSKSRDRAKICLRPATLSQAWAFSYQNFTKPTGGGSTLLIINSTVLWKVHGGDNSEKKICEPTSLQVSAAPTVTKNENILIV